MLHLSSVVVASGECPTHGNVDGESLIPSHGTTDVVRMNDDDDDVVIMMTSRLITDCPIELQ